MLQSNGGNNMVITRTPFRMSFVGGGTDYQPFFEEYGGSVISTTFDKYCYVTVRHQPPFFDTKNLIVYTRMERTTSVAEIEHPLVRNAMHFLDMQDLRVVYDSDLPSRSGLGSSSSFAVGLLNGFHALKGHYANKRELAEGAIHVERTLCVESGGWQDQIITAYGGLNRIDFWDHTFEVRPIVISSGRKKLFNDHLMMFFTGFSRVSSEVAREQFKAVRNKTAELREMLTLVDDGERILIGNGDIMEFGKLLDYAWRLKRGLTNKISNSSIDLIYQKALSAGASGGKLMGAGGGGFFMFFVEPEKQSAVQKALQDFLYVPLVFEDQGAQILYYVPEDYIPQAGRE